MKHLSMAVLCLVMSTSSYAGSNDVWLDVHVGSKHKADGYVENGVHKPFNEVNNGIGLTLRVRPGIDVSAGTFINSIHERSNYVSVDWHTRAINYLRVGVAVGAVTGYEKVIGAAAVVPIVMPNVVLITKRYKALVGVLPVDGGVLTFSVGMKF